MIRINNIAKKFGERGLIRFSLEINDRDVIAILGENGAGKSTLFDCISGLKIPDHGFIEIIDDAITHLKCAYASDTLHVHDKLTAGKLNLILKRIIQDWDESTYNRLLKLFDLECDKRIEDYSRGMKQLLNFSIMLSRHSNLLILDEITSGVDIKRKEIMYSLIREYVQNNSCAVLFSTHSIDDVKAICNRVVIISNGEKVVDKAIDEISADEIIGTITNEGGCNKNDKRPID